MCKQDQNPARRLRCFIRAVLGISRGRFHFRSGLPSGFALYVLLPDFRDVLLSLSLTVGQIVFDQALAVVVRVFQGALKDRRAAHGFVPALVT